MQTLTQKPLEFRQTHDTEYRIYRDNQNVGTIAFNIAAMRWEYNPYGESVKAVGTLEQCQSAAEVDLTPEPTVTVVRVHPTSTKPAYRVLNTTWKTAGPGNSTKVTVRDQKGKFDIWIPSSFARQLRPGCVCIHQHDSVTHEDYLAWPKAAVRRLSAVEA